MVLQPTTHMLPSDVGQKRCKQGRLVSRNFYEGRIVSLFLTIYLNRVLGAQKNRTHPQHMFWMRNKKKMVFQYDLSSGGLYYQPYYCTESGIGPVKQTVIPRQSRRNIVLASSILSVHTFCPSGTRSQYLLARFDAFLS